MCEANNQPDVSDEERAEREGKRPDFQFVYIDHQERDPRASHKQYVVECKRLGNSGRSDWVLNENYVHYGIVRFRDRRHGYGQSTISGAMVGYVQNMELEAVLGEVNRNAAIENLAIIQLTGTGWQPRGVSILIHSFPREVLPTPFTLNHLWLDLTNQKDLGGSGEARRS